MKYFRLALLALTALCAASAPAPIRAENRMKPNGLSFEAGKIKEKDGRSDLYFASIIPQFSFGRLTAVLNINYIADRKYKIRDGGRDFIVLDSLGYNNAEKFNLRYGEIKNLTLGNGFIVSNYRSDILGNVPLNRQRAIELDYKNSKIAIKTFGTQTDLYGARGVISFGDLRLGATAVSDSAPNFTEGGVDIETDLKGDVVKVYADAAKVHKHGSGMAFGAVVKPWKTVALKGEFRDFNADFLPGVVDEHYDATNPFSKITGSGRIHGMYNAIDFQPNPQTSLGLTYERYKARRPRTTVKARGRLGSRLDADVFYAQENNIPKGGWSNPNNSIARAVFTFKLTKYLDIIADYYRAYDETLKQQDSLTFKAHVNLF